MDDQTPPGPELTPSPDLDSTRVSRPEDSDGTYCPRCGTMVPYDQENCPRCGHRIFHEASKVQRYGLLGGLGFIFLGAIFVFFQPRAYHTVQQDLFEGGVVLSVIGAAICFFAAVVDMVRRGGE